MNLVVPERTAALVQRVGIRNRHAGLQLDKFSVVGDQTKQKEALGNVCAAHGDHALLVVLTQRWRASWSALPGASSFCGATKAPLTLHLARASALENAGICLHPIYGFAYLPGSGLKGMARAYAQTIVAAREADVVAVFGNETGERRDQCAGQVVFHDAWPAQWPKLLVDIVNNHHPAYYGADAKDNAKPPGDWENPVPVYFLAVAPDTTFEFALSKRREDAPDHLLDLARQWLAGALCELGAGAKTAAGYGAFKVDAALRDGSQAVAGGDRDSPPRTVGATFETTLELVTPAFLAGASQEAADCDLRGATLRGQLRWWWRTMHAGFVDVATLRQMEAAIWGDMKHGSPVRIVVEPNPRNTKAAEYDKRTLKPEAPSAQKVGPYGVPGAKPEKTTQGLWYASFGMDDAGKKRQYLPPGCRWNLRVACRGAGDLSAEQVLGQVRAALWLLCHYGGVGAKSGKGFGSLSCTLDAWSVEGCLNAAKDVRAALGADGLFRDQLAASPAIGQRLKEFTATFAWPNVWDVLDQIGFALQAFAKQYAHQREKKALGLPRKIGRAAHDGRGDFRPTGPVAQAGANPRHTSPLHVHVAASGGGYIVRLLALPAAHLPDLATSRAFLQKFRDSFAVDMTRRAALSPPAAVSPQHRSTRRSGSARSAPPPVAVAASAEAEWERIDVTYQRRTGNRHLVELADGSKCSIQFGVAPAPPPKSGEKVTVYRQKTGPRECRWQPPLSGSR